jgi:hypothetical protein
MIMDKTRKISFKADLIRKCILHQEDAMKQLQSVMDDAQQMANDYGPPKDRYDPFRNQMLARKDMYARQYQQALEQKGLLEKIDPENLKEKVEFGAVVITDSQKLFIASGIGRINTEEGDFFVISPQVPFYLSLAGKKEGDSYEFRGKNGKIVALF